MVLPRSRSENFALKVAAGESITVAYQKVFKCKRASAEAAGPRLLGNVRAGVSERILSLKVAAASELTLSMRERREYLAQVVRCDILELQKNPDPHGKIIAEVVQEANGRKRYRLPCKLKAIMDDAKLAGDLIDSKDLVSNGQPLPSVLPPINIIVPKAWVNRRKG